jgi:hypothetical protein
MHPHIEDSTEEHFARHSHAAQSQEPPATSAAPCHRGFARIEATVVDRGDQDRQKDRRFSYRGLDAIESKWAQEGSQSPQVMFVGECVCSTHSTRTAQ